MTDHDDLRQVHLFEPLSEAQLARVRESTREINLRPGELLFHQGDPARQFFLILNGSMKLFLLSRDGEEKVVEVMQAGQTFAEAVMFMEQGRYPVNAEAFGEVRLLAFDNDVFLARLRETPDLALRLLGLMSRRLHQMLHEIDELTLHNANYRFLTYLLQHPRAGPDRVELDLPKQLIASRLSMKPETLSRILSRLREQGLVEVDGETITLLDPSGLRALLQG